MRVRFQYQPLQDPNVPVPTARVARTFDVSDVRVEELDTTVDRVVSSAVEALPAQVRPDPWNLQCLGLTVRDWLLAAPRSARRRGMVPLAFACQPRPNAPPVENHDFEVPPDVVRDAGGPATGGARRGPDAVPTDIPTD